MNVTELTPRRFERSSDGDLVEVDEKFLVSGEVNPNYQEAEPDCISLSGEDVLKILDPRLVELIKR